MAARRKTAQKNPSDVVGQSDPKAALDSKELLAAAKPVLKLLAEDLLKRARGSKAVTAALEARHKVEQEQRRTADAFVVWQANFVDQVAAAWLLSCVFVRTLEDRGLLGGARLAGPGAADSQRQFFEMAPSLGERDYLLTVFRELTRFPATRDLFDAQHNPVWLLTPSAAAAQALLGLFRLPSPEAPTFRFGQEDTRFLGDLYQDLNEVVQKRYALLQTPRFVESFILDRTLEPAIKKFGLDETTIIDPTCGSGHFLLGAFDRLYEHRLMKEPALGEREAARKALDAVYGSDINPYAVAIARFRLTLAFLDKAGFKRLAGAPKLPLHLVVADSLLHNAQLAQASFLELEGQSAEEWAGQTYALEDEGAAREVLYRKYAAVVGNPPYITVKDAALRDRYRETYQSAFRAYSLGVPFTERFFQLAREGGSVGMITANSFMKREFGTKLIEAYLPTVNLNLIVNISGAHIPGHGTPTVLLFGTAEVALGTDVLAVLAKRSEPTTPDPAEQGLVWRSIADHWNEFGFENDYISVARIDRTLLKKHPWSLGGGGSADLKELLEDRTQHTLNDLVDAIGFSVITGEDNVLKAPEEVLERSAVLASHRRRLVIGEEIRDWSITAGEHCTWPNRESGERLEASEVPDVTRFLWSCRTSLRARKAFGVAVEEKGIPWWALREVYSARMRTPLTIAFVFVATHNHFVLDYGGKAFNRTAPIIKLRESAAEDDHLALLAYLNSSTACFWMKQAMMNKGGSGIGRGVQDEAWEARFEFDGTKLASIPLQTVPRGSDIARKMIDYAAARESCMPTHRIAEHPTSTGLSLADTLSTSSQLADLTLAGMVSLQEELDWLVYEAYGLLTKDDLALLIPARQIALPDFPRLIDMRPEEVHRHGLFPGHRAFEIVLARDSLISETKTAWFSRNDYASPSEVKDIYAPSYQRLLEARVQIIDRNPMIRLLEQPEYKRRWTVRDYAAETQAAARLFVTSALEKIIASAVEVQRAGEMVGSALRDAKIQEVTSLLGDHDGGPRATRETLLPRDAVPFLAAYRYTDAGLDKRALWEQTWDLQRKEDAGEKVPPFDPAPRYDSKDYRDATTWTLRGKLDVPKERFISYPGCESDHDKEPVYGWAGWNHLQQAQALSALYQNRKQEEAWGKDRLTPMLAGLLELIPWIKQWHNEPSEEYAGLRLGESSTASSTASAGASASPGTTSAPGAPRPGSGARRPASARRRRTRRRRARGMTEGSFGRGDALPGGFEGLPASQAAIVRIFPPSSPRVAYRGDARSAIFRWPLGASWLV